MCGIVAIANGPIKVGGDWITQALYADAVRGWDSTGLIAVRDGKPSYYKRALPAADFINTRVYKRMVSTSAQAFIGHNRAATIGSVSDNTAHPFQFDHITGVHNGTLDYGWRDTLKDGKKFDVDSEALIYNIALNGVEDAVKKASGAFAIIYHDARDNTLNVIRNDERPMFYGRMNYKDDKWVFGSEAGLIEWITERVDGGDRLKDVWELKSGKLLTLDLKTQEMTLRDVEVAGRSTKSYGPFLGRSIGNANNKSTGTGHSATTKNSGKRTTATKPNVMLMPNEKNTFQKLAIEPDERLEFWITGWEGYKNNPEVGTLFGVMVEDPWIETIMFGVKQGEFDKDGIYASYPVNIRRKAGVADRIDDCRPDQLEMVLSVAHAVEVVYTAANDYHTTVINVDEEDDDDETPWLLQDKRPMGPHGERLSRVEFDKLTSKGCSCCNANILYGMDRVHWTIDGQPLCDGCNTLLAKDAVGGHA